MSTQAAAQHEHAADPYGHAARPSMDEERIQMVVDYYKATDTPHLLMLYAMSDHSAEAYEAFRRLLTARPVAIPPQSGPRQSSSRRRQPVALVRARVLLGIAALASLDWRTAVVALVAAGASWRRSERFQQGAVLGTVLFLRGPRDSLGGSPRHAFLDVRYKHGAPSSWWCELRVGGVGLRESMASAGSATQLKMGKTFSFLEHMFGEGAFNARADMSYVLWERH
jgi:hypothetical protein